MNEPNIVILAAGVSSRMKRSPEYVEGVDTELLREARERPKAMLRVGGRSQPFLNYVLGAIEQAGYRDVVIVVGEHDSPIREYYELAQGGKAFTGLNISYAIQRIPAGRSKPLGTADALVAALQTKKDWKGSAFTVCNSDNLYSVEALRAMLDDSHANAMIDYDRSFLQFDQSRIAQFAILKKDDEGFLAALLEKPTDEQILHAADDKGRIGVSMNLFRLSYDMILPVLETLPLHPVRNEKELPVAVNLLAQLFPKSIWTVPRAEHVPDLTSQADITIVQEYLKHYETS